MKEKSIRHYRGWETKRRCLNTSGKSEDFPFERLASLWARTVMAASLIVQAVHMPRYPSTQLQAVAGSLAGSKAEFSVLDWLQSPGSQRFRNQNVDAYTHKHTLSHRPSPEETELQWEDHLMSMALAPENPWSIKNKSLGYRAHGYVAC